MCHKCDKEVIEMGILESDMPNLPYKLAKWLCMVADCKNACRVRDYGIAPLYYWPVKVRRKEDGGWYGGWVSSMHGYICSAHWPEFKKGKKAFCNKHANTIQFHLDRVQPIIKAKRHNQ
jgi:hypothetical protein